MQPFTEHTGIVVPLDRVNVDTDAIIPKQFLKRIERTGFGAFLFFDWRFKDDGAPNPDFILNREPYRSGSILLTRANFGCGSSREHAPWALWDCGFRVILAPSFADIFYNNCFKNGMLPLVFSEAQIDDLFRRATAPTAAKEGYRLKVDLVSQTITGPDGLSLTFTIDPFRRECLLGGLDDIGLTLRHADKIAAFEKARAG